QVNVAGLHHAPVPQLCDDMHARPTTEISASSPLDVGASRSERTRSTASAAGAMSSAASFAGPEVAGSGVEEHAATAKAIKTTNRRFNEARLVRSIGVSSGSWDHQFLERASMSGCLLAPYRAVPSRPASLPAMPRKRVAVAWRRWRQFLDR